MASPDTPVPAVRRVTDVETLKVLSDPLRLAILRALRQGGGPEPRVWSVKELAAELDEPQTKLYRHIKQLVDRGLVQVAETRLVSGIVEQRYRSGQLSLQVDDAFLGGEEGGADQSQKLFDAAFDSFRNEYATALRQGRIPHDTAAPEKYREPGLFSAQVRLTPARAAEFRERLMSLLDEYGRADDPDGTVPVRLLTVYYSPEPRD